MTVFIQVAQYVLLDHPAFISPSQIFIPSHILDYYNYISMSLDLFNVLI